MTNTATNAPSDQEKERATVWFNTLRDQLCAAFEGLEEAVTGPPLHQPDLELASPDWDCNFGVHRHGYISRLATILLMTAVQCSTYNKV